MSKVKKKRNRKLKDETNEENIRFFEKCCKSRKKHVRQREKMKRIVNTLYSQWLAAWLLGQMCSRKISEQERE